MGKLITLIIVGILAVGSWQFLQSIFATGKIDTILRDSADLAKNWDEGQVESDIIQRAEKAGISLTPDDVDVEISFGANTGVAAGMVAQHGIQSQAKRISMTVRYTHPILFFSRTQEVRGSKNITVQATLPPGHPTE